MTKRKTADTANWVNHGFDTERRLLWLSGTVDEESVDAVMKGIVLLGERPEPVKFLLNTDGGDVTLGLALYDALRALEGEVHVHVWAKAYSMGSIIFQAGDRRTIAPHGSVMIHGGDVVWSGQVETAKRWAKFDAAHGARADAILLERLRCNDPKLTKKKFEQMLVVDTIFTASEAVAVGLADSIE